MQTSALLQDFKILINQKADELKSLGFYVLNSLS
jgi:hypothetical protein